MASRKVIVVGAGIGGLSAAHWLRQRGYEVEVLEASDRPGVRVGMIEPK
jgi:phytoene dehydrogenase-like protein